MMSDIWIIRDTRFNHASTTKELPQFGFDNAKEMNDRIEEQIASWPAQECKPRSNQQSVKLFVKEWKRNLLQ